MKLKYAIFTGDRLSLATADRLSPTVTEGCPCIPLDKLTAKQREWFDRPKHCDRFMRRAGRSWSCPCGFTQTIHLKPVRQPKTAQRERDRAEANRKARKTRAMANQKLRRINHGHYNDLSILIDREKDRKDR